MVSSSRPTDEGNIKSWPKPSYHFSVDTTEEQQNRRLDGHEKQPDLRKQLDIVHRFRPVILFFNAFGCFPCRFPQAAPSSGQLGLNAFAGQLRWRFQLVYTTAIVCMLLAFCVSQTIEYQLKVAEEPPCASAACVIRKMPGPIFAALVCFLSIYSAFEFRKFGAIFVHWNKVIRMAERCFRTCTSSKAGNVHQSFHVSRRTVVCVLCALYATAFFEHGLGNGYMSMSCAQQLGAKCNVFKFVWDAITHRNASRAEHHGIGFLNVAVYATTKYSLVVWNMADCLILIFGLCLNRNLDTFNLYLSEFVKAPRTVREWRNVRKAHLGLCEVLVGIDDLLSPATLGTVVGVCFFISYQLFFHLFAVLKLFGSCVFCAPNRAMRITYGLVSFLHLAARITGVCLMGARVIDRVKAPLKILRQYRTDDANIEVLRFWHHVTDTKAGFTGMKMFTLNKELLLNMLGIFITYEMLFLSLGKEEDTVKGS